MTGILKILLLEDSVADADLVSWQLNHAKLRHELRRVETRDEFLRALDEYQPDVILSDHTMPSYDGLSALRDARLQKPAIPFLFVSGTLGEERAVESLKQGASDYVVKGDLMRLPSAIERAIKEKRLRREREQIEQQLRQSERIFKSLAEQAPIGIVLNDTELNTLFVNTAWDQIAGCKAKDIFSSGSESWLNLIHLDDREHISAALAKLLRDQQPMNVEYRFLRPTGEIRWLSARVAVQLGDAGELTGFIGLTSDITEQKLAEQKIIGLTRIHEVLSGINSTIVRVRDREQLCHDACRIAVDKGKFSFAWVALVNPADESIRTSALKGTGDDSMLVAKHTRHEKIGDASPYARQSLLYRKRLVVNDVAAPGTQFIHPDDIERTKVSSMIYLPLLHADQAFGVLVLGSESRNYFTEDEIHLLTELSEDIAFAVDHLDKEERLNYLAYYDPLSGLPNRTLFIDHLHLSIDDAKREGHGVAVIALNIERFRHINETFGESIGDALLKAVAERLTAWVSDADRIGHFGGDSFGIFVPRLDDLSGLPGHVERKFEEWLKLPFSIREHKIVAPLKLGIAFFPDDGKDAETVFQNANAALKQAKQSKDRVAFYSQEFNARAAEILRLENRLREALARRELMLYYQPKVNLHNHRVASVEALMRWQDRERGMVPPNEFIPILEDTGMIHEAGLWALRQAHADHQRLRALLPTAPLIAVNVSALQLKNKDFHKDILDVIQQRPDSGHGIEIEITESLLMQNIEDNIGKLKDIREHNIRIAVDDFGTGYSSLAYIAKLPIDILKIDRSFIAKMMTSGDDMAIVSTIITLAHSLNLIVVAEGVETEEQATKLRDLQCDKAQGYLFCRPLPFDEFVKKLAVEDGHVVLRQD